MVGCLPHHAYLNCQMHMAQSAHAPYSNHAIMPCAIPHPILKSCHHALCHHYLTVHYQPKLAALAQGLRLAAPAPCSSIPAIASCLTAYIRTRIRVYIKRRLLLTTPLTTSPVPSAGPP